MTYAGMLWLIAFILCGYPLSRIVLHFLNANRIVAQNYRNQLIPVSTGLFFAVLFILFLFWTRFGIAVGTEYLTTYAVSNSNFTIMVLIVFFVGWLDDSVGDRTVKGFKGHLHKWRNERIVTTGLLKAASIAFVSLWAVWELHLGSFGSGQLQAGFEAGGFIQAAGAWLFRTAVILLVFVMQWLLMTLSANVLNLFDLRPGRALKLAALTMLITILFGDPALYFPYLVPVATGIVWLFPSDVRGGSMLGDAGANMIGFVLGFCIALSCPLWLQLVVTCGFVWIHWLAERISISKYIESRPVLRRLDMWGRQ